MNGFNLKEEDLLRQFREAKQLEIENLLTQYGGSLQEIREMYPQLKTAIESQRLATQLDTQPFFFAPDEAAQMGLNLQEGWLLKMTPIEGNGGYTSSLITPQKWEITENDLYISPSGEQFSKADLAALLGIPTGGLETTTRALSIGDLTEQGRALYHEYQESGGELDVPGWLDLHERQQLETEQVFGAVFPQRDIDEVISYMQANPEAFIADLREIGWTPQTEALLKTIAPDITEVEMYGIFGSLPEIEESGRKNFLDALRLGFTNLFKFQIPRTFTTLIPQFFTSFFEDPEIVSQVVLEGVTPEMTVVRDPDTGEMKWAYTYGGQPVAGLEELEFPIEVEGAAPIAPPSASISEIGKWAQQASEKFQQRYEESKQQQLQWLIEHPELQPPAEYEGGVIEKFQKGEWDLLKSGWYWAYVAAESAAFTSAFMGTSLIVGTITQNPYIGLMAGWALTTPAQVEDLYEDLRASGASDDMALRLAVPIGAVINSVEMWGDLPALKAISPVFSRAFAQNVRTQLVDLTWRQIIRKGLKTITDIEIAETLEEVIQQGIQNATVMTIDQNRDLFEGIDETIIRTLVATLPLAWLGGGTQTARLYHYMNSSQRTQINDTIATLTQNGVPRDQAELVAIGQVLETSEGQEALQKAVDEVSALPEIQRQAETALNQIQEQNPSLVVPAGNLGVRNPSSITDPLETDPEDLLSVPTNQDIQKGLLIENWMKTVLKKTELIPGIGKVQRAVLGWRSTLDLQNETTEAVVGRAALVYGSITRMGVNTAKVMVGTLRSILTNPVRYFGFNQTGYSATMAARLLPEYKGDENAGTLEDVFTHPEKYDWNRMDKGLDYVTRFIRIQRAIFALLQKERVALGLVNEAWMHRVVTSRTVGEEVIEARGRPGRTGRAVGATPSYEKPRAFETMAEGIQASIQYEPNPEVSIGSYIEEAYKKIAGNRVEAELQAFGVTPAERLMERFPEIVEQAERTKGALADAARLHELVLRAKRGEKLTEQTLRAMERRFPQLGRRLRVLVKAGSATENQLRQVLKQNERLIGELRTQLERAKAAKPGVAKVETIRVETTDIEPHVETKYGKLPGEESEAIASYTPIELLEDRELTPEQIDEALSNLKTAAYKLNEIEAIEGAIADQTGDLIETYRYESWEDGQNLERYLDSLLEVTQRHRKALGVPRTVDLTIEPLTGRAMRAAKPEPVEVPDEVKLREAFGLMDYEDRNAFRETMNSQLEDIGQMLAEQEVELEALTETFENDRARPFIDVVAKTGEYKGEIAYLTVNQYRILTGAKWQTQTVEKMGKTIKRRILVGGHMPTEGMMTPDGKKVRWEYALDTIATELGFRSDEDLKKAIEAAVDTKQTIDDFRVMIRSGKERLKGVNRMLKVLTEVESAPEVVEAEVIEPAPEAEINEIAHLVNLLREERVWIDTFATEGASIVHINTGETATIIEPPVDFNSINYDERAMHIKWADGREMVVDAAEFAPSSLQKTIALITHGEPIPAFPESIIPQAEAAFEEPVGITQLKELMREYQEKGLTQEDWWVGVKGAYRERHPYFVGPGVDLKAMQSDLAKAGYEDFKQMWEDVARTVVGKAEAAPEAVVGRGAWTQELEDARQAELDRLAKMSQHEKSQLALEYARKVYAPYILRGDTVEQIKKGGLGFHSPVTGSVETGGYTKAGKKLKPDDVLVTLRNDAEFLFKLKDIAESIRNKPPEVREEAAIYQAAPVAMSLDQFKNILDRVTNETRELYGLVREQWQRWVVEKAGQLSKTEEADIRANRKRLKEQLQTLETVQKNPEEYYPRLQAEFPNLYKILYERAWELRVIPRRLPKSPVPISEARGKYFTLKKAQDAVRIIPKNLTDEQLQEHIVKLRDYMRYIEMPDKERLVEGGYYASVVDVSATGLVPLDPWLYTNLGQALDEALQERAIRQMPEQIPGMPEAGLQVDMFGFQTPVQPRGKGVRRQISLDDYQKLVERYEEEGKPMPYMRVKPKIEGVSELSDDTDFQQEIFSTPEAITPEQKKAEFEKLAAEAKGIMEFRKVPYWQARALRAAKMEIVRQPGIGEGYLSMPFAGGRIFNQDFIDACNQFFGAEKGLPGLSFVSDAAGILRMTKASLDFSAMAIQGTPSFGLAHAMLLTSPRIGLKMMGAWYKALAYSTAAFFQPSVFYNYQEKNQDVTTQRISFLGSSRAIDYFDILRSKRGLGKLAAWLFEKMPLDPYERAELSFYSAGEIVRNEFWKALSPKAISQGKGFELARHLDLLTGISDSQAAGVPLSVRQLESSFMWFAPNYTRACLSLVADIFRGGYSGAQAKRALGGLLGAAVAYYIGVQFAISLLSGKDEDDAWEAVKEGLGIDEDPITGEVAWRPTARFMTVKVGNYYMGIGGFWYGLVRLFGNISACINEVGERERIDLIKILDQGSINRDNPFVYWWYSRSSPIVGTGLELYNGRDFLGYPLETAGDYARYLMTRFEPIWMEQGLNWMIPGAVRDYEIPEDVARAAVPVFEIFGWRTFPESSWVKFYDRVENFIKEIPFDELDEKQVDAWREGNLGWGELTKKQQQDLLQRYPELAELYEAALNDSRIRDSGIWKEYTDRMDEERGIYYGRIDEYTQRLLAGEIDTREYRELCSEAGQNYGAIIEAMERDPNYAEIYEYFDDKEAEGVKYEFRWDLAYAEYNSMIRFAEDPGIYLPNGDYNWDERDRRIADFIDQWGEDLYYSILDYISGEKEEKGLNPVWLKKGQDSEKLSREYWNLPYKPIIDMTQEDYDEGNIPAEYYSLWHTYQGLSDEDKEGFVALHPELGKDWRAEYRKNNPEADAMLALWGYSGKLQSMEAYGLLKQWSSELGIPLSKMGLGLPAESLMPSYFEYSNLLAEHSALSPQAKLWKLQNPDFTNWAVENWGWEGTEDYKGIDYYQLQVKWADKENEYNAIEGDIARQQFLQANREFWTARLKMKALDIEFPEDLVPDYVEWYQSDFKDYEDDWWLMEHQDFYKTMYDLEIWTEPRDFDTVPTREVWSLYQQYQKLPAGTPRLDFRAMHPDLDAWLVLKFGYKPIGDRGNPEADLEPWDVLAQAEEFKQQFPTL